MLITAVKKTFFANISKNYILLFISIFMLFVCSHFDKANIGCLKLPSKFIFSFWLNVDNSFYTAVNTAANDYIYAAKTSNLPKFGISPLSMYECIKKHLPLPKRLKMPLKPI